MRLSLVIAALAVIAVGLVHIRRSETSVNHQIQQLQLEQIYLRRKLYDQQVTLGRLVSPSQVRERMEKLDLRLTSRVVTPPGAPQRLAAEQPQAERPR
jgi:cell division protein FtsL